MRSFAAAAFILVLAGCTTSLYGAEVDADGFAPVVFGAVAFHEEDIVDTRDMRLHADVYLPDEPLVADAPERFPTILVLSPYFGDGSQGEPFGYAPYDWLVQELAPRGYAVVFGDLAGSGGSSGCWDYMGPVERASAYAMVEGIAAQPWSDGKVGMFGISYDGMSQIMAASDAAPHLVTVVPVAPLTHTYAGLIQNGVRYDGLWRTTAAHYETESLTPIEGSRSRFEGWTRRLVESPPCATENHASEIALDSYSAYFAARDYRPLGANVQASVFYIQGLRDFNVKPDNFGAWFDAVPTQKKAWIGNWMHAYPDGQNGGRDALYTALHRWLDHELKGVDNGIELEPRFDIEDSRSRWRTADEWPPADATPLTFRLFADGALALSGGSEGTVSVGGPDALPSALPGAQPRGANFTSAPLAQGFHLSGSPVVRLTLASDRPVGQIVARLYDNGWRVSQGALDLTYRNGLDAPQPLLAREPVEVEIVLYGAEHEVPAGHTLVLQLATHDPTSWYEDDASSATLTLFTGAASTIELPTIVPESS